LEELTISPISVICRYYSAITSLVSFKSRFSRFKETCARGHRRAVPS